MAEPGKPFPHTRMGFIDPWSQQASGIAQMYGGDQWGGIRDQIARYRAGGPGRGAGPKGADFPGFDRKSDEDKRLTLWLIESLMSGGPPGELGYSGKGARVLPEDIGLEKYGK